MRPLRAGKDGAGAMTDAVAKRRNCLRPARMRDSEPVPHDGGAGRACPCTRQFRV